MCSMGRWATKSSAHEWVGGAPNDVCMWESHIISTCDQREWLG